MRIRPILWSLRHRQRQGLLVLAARHPLIGAKTLAACHDPWKRIYEELQD